MKYTVSILIIFGSIFSQSQNHHFIYSDKCGSPPPNDNEIVLENNIKNWLIKNPNYTSRSILNIPVAFHIIYEDNSSDGGYISETLINNQVDVLNAAFIDANISFSIDSIEYIQNSNWYNNDDEYVCERERGDVSKFIFVVFLISMNVVSLLFSCYHIYS